MLLTANKQRRIILKAGVLALALGLLGVSCTRSEKAEPASVAPWTVQNANLASRTPQAFPPGTDDATKIAELREHLRGVADLEPDADVLAVVLLSREITIDEFIGFANALRLSAGGHAAIRIVCGGAMHAAALTSQHLSEGGFVLSAENVLGCNGDIVVRGFSAYSTPRRLLELWNDTPDVIRAIGVEGRRGDTPYTWMTLPGPGEPVR